MKTILIGDLPALATGPAMVIPGQMLLSVIIDSKGIGGTEAISLSFSKISGLLLLRISVYLLLPKG